MKKTFLRNIYHFLFKSFSHFKHTTKPKTKNHIEKIEKICARSNNRIKKYKGKENWTFEKKV